MGYTRARRYANHKGGRKYTKKNGKVKDRVIDYEKVELAKVFEEVWKVIREDKEYLEKKKKH